MSNRIQSLALVILAAPVMALALAAATVSADTIYVCWDGSGDYLTIQEGIDAAVDGDEVVVCDGTYTSDGNQDLDFGGKSITVRSESSDPNACIIDCERSGRGFYFHSGETAVVDGFTITNGYARHDGAGVHCEGAEATITNCTISSNEAEFDGGGVCCWDGSLTITDCTISSNDGHHGGGVFCYGGQATITNCTISNNSGYFSGGVCCRGDGAATITNCTISGNSGKYGGGVCCDSRDTTISDCTISENSAEDGGGVCCEGRQATITNCTISDNSAEREGGGVCCVSRDTTITDCTISGNEASDGGGVSCYGGDLTITNCAISYNSAEDDGGAVYCYFILDGVAITNCTISDNSAEDDGGVYCYVVLSDVAITNCILWGDQPQEIYVQSGTVTATYCDIQGRWPGEGNIDADPLFVIGPFGNYYLSQTAAGQEQDSPCVDAGSDTAENLGLNTRTTRTDQVPDSGIVDLGYHYPIVCPGDLDGDGDTDQADLGILLGDWGCDDPVNGCEGDLNGDDKTDQSDLGILLAGWGCGT